MHQDIPGREYKIADHHRIHRKIEQIRDNQEQIMQDFDLCRWDQIDEENYSKIKRNSGRSHERYFLNYR